MPGSVLAAAWAAIAALLGGAASWVPSFWTDEVATINATSRPLPELWALLGERDAVHGLYYVLMHSWVTTWGTGPVSMRFPSAIAIGIMVGFAVATIDAFRGRRAAMITGLVATVIPASMASAIDARSPALVAAGASAAGYCLLRATSGSGRWWVPYSLAAAATCGLSVVATGLLVAHAITVIISVHAWRGRLIWMAAATPAILVAAPIAWLGAAQSSQIDWVPEVTPFRVAGIYGAAAWFDEKIVIGAIAWTLVAIGTISLSRRAHGRHDGSARALLALTLPWLIVPGLVLVAASLLLTPMLVPRYLVLCVPAVAMLAASGIEALPRPRLTAPIAIVLLTVPCIVAAYQQRTPFGADESDWASAAREVDSRASNGEPIVFVPDGGEDRSPRRAIEAYPHQFTAVTDVGIVSTAQDAGAIWGFGVPIEDSAPILTLSEKSWALVALTDAHPDAESATRLLAEFDLTATLVWEGPSTMLFEVQPAD